MPRSDVITNGLPAHSAAKVRPMFLAAEADARPAVASDTPVATSRATRTTATRMTAAPAGPRPLCNGRPMAAPR